MSGFSIDWLDLREPADHRARDSAMRGHVLEWLESGASASHAPLVVDLGCGSGSTLRALDTSPARWRLVDHDELLLAEARRRHQSEKNIETFVGDLSALHSLPLAGARLLTASALFDLVSADFTTSLAEILRAQSSQVPVGLYAALNYDGITRWTPAHPLDEPVLQAFNADQRRDKGFGPALGPDAGKAIQQSFAAAGFQVYLADSPWLLDGDDEALVTALIEGIVGALRESRALARESLSAWADYRKAHVSTGTCTVGHVDVLALPLP